MDESISLRELVDVDIIQSIQDRFAKTVGVSSVIFLPDGDALTRFSNPTEFCSLIRSTKEGRRRCFQSFTEMNRKAVELSEPEIMYCFAYGAHFVAPIIVDGERKATMYAGQFRPEKFSPEQLKELEKIAVEIDLDPELLAREAKNMRTVKDKVVWACLNSFFRTVKVIAELGAQALELRQAKDALQNAHDELEMRVQERTAELIETNEELRREVAERKAAEDALRESEEKYRTLIENVQDGVFLIQDGELKFVNEAFARISGYTVEEIHGMGFRGLVAPDDRAMVTDRYVRMMAGEDMPMEYEFHGIQKNGDTRTTVYMTIGLLEYQGEPAVIGTLKDITGQKRTVDALRKSEEKYRTLFEMVKDAIFWSDETGKFVDVNQAACESLGYSREELLRLSNREIDADLRGYEAFLKVRNTPAKEAIFEVNQRRKDGTLLPVEITGKFFEIDGELRSLAIARDITERKAAEEQIKRALREKNVLMHEIHHRVKNNLQVVSSLLSMQARTTRSKEAIDVLSKSQSRINTMALIHTQLYESGDLSELNMEEFVGTLSEELFRSYPVNDTRIARIVNVTDRKFPVSVGVYVGLIINELLSNALQHAFGEGKEGKIEVSLTASDSGRINLRVSDDGVGLPPGFDIDKTRSLGLHLVKILLEDQLQGKLEVISDGGVTFNMEFDIECNGGSSYGEDKNTDR